MPRYPKGSKMYGPGTAAGKKAFVKATKAIAKVVAPKKNKVAKGFAKKVQAVLKRNLETKYIAQDIVGGTQVPSGQTTPGQLKIMLPNLAQGVGDSQRIGDTIKPVSARSMFTVNFNALNTDFTDVQLNLVILYVKGASTAAAVAAIPPGQLLRVGNGTNTDPDATVYTQEQFLQHINKYHINPELYTLKKWYKRRFAKGSYDINGVPGANATSQIAINQPAHTFTFKWKPPTLKYNVAGSPLPSNHYPVYLIWCTANDGTTYSGQLNYGLRTEIYFKDA